MQCHHCGHVIELRPRSEPQKEWITLPEVVQALAGNPVVFCLLGDGVRPTYTVELETVEVIGCPDDGVVLIRVPGRGEVEICSPSGCLQHRRGEVLAIRFPAAAGVYRDGLNAWPLWGLPAPCFLLSLGGLMCLMAVRPLIGLFQIRDMEYHFLGSQRQLSVRDRRGEKRVVPFAEIVRADVDVESGSAEESALYGLRLKLRSFFRTLVISQDNTSGDKRRQKLQELADRINRFLAAHRYPC
jgi:hypothetical protein